MQVLAKFLFPFLLIIFALYINIGAYQQRVNNSVRKTNNISHDLSFYDFNSVITKDFRLIAWSEEHCSLSSRFQIGEIYTGFAVIEDTLTLNSSESVDYAKDLVRRVNKYGILPSSFYNLMASTLLFVFYLLNCLYCFIYIGYLSKAE